MQKKHIIIGIIILIFFIILTAIICIPPRDNTWDTSGIERIETRIVSIEERVGIISGKSDELAEQNKVLRDLITGFGKEISDNIGAIKDIGNTASITTDGLQSSVEGLGRGIDRIDSIEKGLSELERILRETENNNNTTENTVVY